MAIVETASSTEQFADAFLPRKDVEEWGRDARRRIIDEIRERGLVERAWELDVDGYTVLSPEEAGTAEIAPQVLDASLDFTERKYGWRPDLDREGEREGLISPFGNVQPEIGVLGEGRVFEQALLNPVVLAMMRYLLGESCALIHQSLFLKCPGPDHLPLHTDQDQTVGPSPLQSYAQVANANWALTDYTVENGAICFVPGSHRLGRAPTRHEATDLSLFEPVEMKAGSVVIWHGNTWHGALRRSAPGVRATLVEYFGRQHLAGANTSTVTQEMLDRNPPQFAELLRTQAQMQGLGETKFQAAKETLYG
ncbi:MAG: phytanoyl-CoA dioxygenase family protein [Novosphingobium sp.]|nr:phytanoyl-CoA dioxygenase family protein [Novosphingobium sp.]